ncbi:SGNH/GDSL hydrolase family protein [Limibacillus halophilus]|uniref:Lysophospholipase L1-like esterase n=1 Tax=Limibacillus halophilus TaxID=1579333 RepID=A0A839T0L8_9PROT|nr:SGNH/GDSL hydrolase family protein [Limibacillus halophilus]MBB3066895.1 lysophospholipase L1-like esterase [Limibacillus halophilus]
MQITSALRTLFINFAVLIGLILGLLFVTALLGDGYNLAKSLFPKDDKRADLPSYEDPEYARQVFRDQKGSIKDYIPFVEWRQSEVSRETLTIDASGRRQHGIGRDNDAGAATLGVFGGSTVWGTGVDDNGTIPAQLDALTDKYEVTNYGERGYTTLQNLIDLMTLINEQRAPEVVVFYEGFNDVWVHCNYAVTEHLNGHLEERRIQAALDRTGKEDYLYNTILVPILAFVTRISGGGDDSHLSGCSEDPQRADAVAEMFVRTLEMAEVLVRANGGRFHAFLQPSAYFANPRSDYLDLGDADQIAQRAQFAAVYPLILEKMAARAHPWFSDLSGALDNDQMLLIDHVHVTPLGNSLLAEKISAALK